MTPVLVPLLVATLQGAAVVPGQLAAPAPEAEATTLRTGVPLDAVAVVDTALARMGGRETLESIETARFRMVTVWQRSTFDGRPYTDLPSYEAHTDVRNYRIGGWHNTREFGSRTVRDLVRDSVAARDFGQGFQPLSVAYVDERDELFLLTPDRLVLRLRETPDLALAADTLVDGMVHRTVTATLDGVPVRVLFRRADGLPAMLGFRKDHANDYGLTPWGPMEVEIWYAKWQTFPPGVTIPTQWNVRRAGSPYKRMTVQAAELNPELEGGLFEVPDSVRKAFAEGPASRPMHDLPVDSGRVVDGRLVELHGFGNARGAVRLGDGWLLLEAGQAPLNFERGTEWVENETGEPVTAVLTTLTRTGNGGVAGAVRAGVPVLAGAGAAPFVRTMLDNRGLSPDFEVVPEEGRWLVAGDDSLRVERIDLPDARGATILWAPTLRWLYAPEVTNAVDLRLVLLRAREQGWPVERVGTSRALVRPVEPPTTG